MTKKNSIKALSKNKGFTLVELIVVLVILAILAAILVPTLLGYIDRARSEKDYSTAQAVRVAAQAQIDELYGKGNDSVDNDTINDNDKNKNEGAILNLVCGNKEGKLDGQTISIEDVTIKNNQITSITVGIKPASGTMKKYKYDSNNNTWAPDNTTTGG